jgi:hypothetical protein
MFTFTANLLSRLSWIAPRGSDSIATVLWAERAHSLSHDSHEVVTLGRGP